MRWHLPQGLESELMGLPGDVATHIVGAGFTAPYPERRRIHTHTRPYIVWPYEIWEIAGRYGGRVSLCCYA